MWTQSKYYAYCVPSFGRRVAVGLQLAPFPRRRSGHICDNLADHIHERRLRRGIAGIVVIVLLTTLMKVGDRLLSAWVVQRLGTRHCVLIGTVLASPNAAAAVVG